MRNGPDDCATLSDRVRIAGRDIEGAAPGHLLGAGADRGQAGGEDQGERQS
ncbi:MAG TPA: hypothetical protein VGC15_24740 [Acetobacteraceae bacterium]